MKPGFTLLEIILATGLAAMISVSLIFMLQQMNKTLIRVDRVSDLDMRAAMLQNQMERDLSGAFAPTDFSATNTTGEAKEGKPKKIEKIFWADNTLETLSFITNNPLHAYWGERSGKPQPKIVRVVYHLVPDAKHKDAYVLMRQQGSDLNLDAYAGDPSTSSGLKAYPMIEGIRNIRIEYTTLVKKPASTKEEPKQQTPNAQQTTQPENQEPEKPAEEPAAEATASKEEYERHTVQEWKDNITDQKPPWPLIPQFVTMHVTLWDDTFKRTQSFTFEFQIMPRFEKVVQEATPKVGWSSLLGGRS